MICHVSPQRRGEKEFGKVEPITGKKVEYFEEELILGVALYVQAE